MLAFKAFAARAGFGGGSLQAGQALIDILDGGFGRVEGGLRASLDGVSCGFSAFEFGFLAC